MTGSASGQARQLLWVPEPIEGTELACLTGPRRANV